MSKSSTDIKDVLNFLNFTTSSKQKLSCCWDGRAMLHKSNFRFRVGIPLFNASFLSNLWECHPKLYIAEN